MAGHAYGLVVVIPVSLILIIGACVAVAAVSFKVYRYQCNRHTITIRGEYRTGTGIEYELYKNIAYDIMYNWLYVNSMN